MPKDTVLVVESDAALRGSALRMLEDTGAEVIEFESAADALPYLVEHADDVAAVFTDTETPGCLDGLQLARSITATWPDIMVVVKPDQARSPSEASEDVQPMSNTWTSSSLIAAVAV